MIKQISIALVLLSLTSCVSKKIYTDLENKYTDLKKENRALADENEELLQSKVQLEAAKDELEESLKKMTEERDQLQTDYNALAAKYKVLQDSYKALEKNSNESLENNMKKNRELLQQLEAKEKALAIEQEKFNKNSKRLRELEDMIAEKEAAMNKLKETLSKALNSFEGKGLTVYQKNGKVYVSMENKLLFNSGSWAVGAEGKKAVVEVAKVLAANPDISVLIEGHTDNDPYNGSGPIADNWDLSTKRATSIVEILCENKGVIKKNLTAAGRSEYYPLESNSTAEGKAKNRRIEIILTPRLDEISKMLNEF
ncbi:MAG TPA: OmpA family protein [Flavobacterium sp.]|nr:OmpA family protein [Flavobacterium sp.]